MAALTDENAELKEQMRQQDSVSREKGELERQLGVAKDNLFAEQRQYRDRVEALEEVQYIILINVVCQSERVSLPRTYPENATGDAWYSGVHSSTWYRKSATTKLLS